MYQLLEGMNVMLPFWILLLLASLLSFLIAYFSIPVIVHISKAKNLYDYTNERKMHNNATPVLGGLAIFAGIALSSVIFCPENGYLSLTYILGGLIIVTIIGLKDDILISSPGKKLIGLFLAASVVAVLGDIRVTDFQGILGLSDIGYFPGIVFSVLLIVFFIVSFNFIDGIDGLAASFGTFGSILYGIWFLIAGNEMFSLLSFAMASALIAFTRYNLFSIKNKIFLGDTGAMITGLVSAVLTIEFIELQSTVPLDIKIPNAPLLSAGIFFILISDALRVLVGRLFARDLFKSAKNHIHHVLVANGFSQKSTLLILLSLNTAIFFSFILLRNTSPGFLLIFAFLLGSFIVLIVGYLKKRSSTGEVLPPNQVRNFNERQL